MLSDKFDLKKLGGGYTLKIIQPPKFNGKLSQDVLDALRDFYDNRRGHPIIRWSADEELFAETRENGGIIHYTFQIFKEFVTNNKDDKNKALIKAINGQEIDGRNFYHDNFYGYADLMEQTEYSSIEKFISKPPVKKSNDPHEIGKVYSDLFDPNIHDSIFHLIFNPSQYHQNNFGRTGNKDRNEFYDIHAHVKGFV